jgi:hypothetical protein
LVPPRALIRAASSDGSNNTRTARRIAVNIAKLPGLLKR